MNLEGRRKAGFSSDFLDALVIWDTGPAGKSRTVSRSHGSSTSTQKMGSSVR